MKKLVPIALSAVMVSVCAANELPLIDDNFEGYANTAEMQAVWGAAGLGTLATTTGFSGTQSMQHPGGADNTIQLAADLFPTDANPIVLRGRMYDDGASNKRFSIGIRSLSTFPLFEMGRYNAVIGQDYYVRMTTFPGLSVNWVDLGLGAAVQGWHTFEAVFTASDITVSVDLGSDSVVDTTQVFAIIGPYTRGSARCVLGVLPVLPQMVAVVTSTTSTWHRYLSRHPSRCLDWG